MAGKLEEDYWNETSGSSFKFDDEHESTNLNTYLNSDCILNTSIEIYNILPLTSLLSPKNIETVLADIDVDPIKNNTNRNSFTNMLTTYYKFDQKIDLLNETILTYDGNLILQTIVFLSKTLKAILLYRYLSQKEIALNHYIIYLAALKCTELSELLQMSSTSRSYFLKLFYNSIEPTTVDSKKNKLAKFILEYVDTLKGNYEKSIIFSYKTFVDFQVDKKICAPNAAKFLIELYNRTKYDLSDSNTKHFIKVMNMTDFQTEWLLFNSIASTKNWDKMKESFTSSNWITKKRCIKTCMQVESLILALHKHGASNDLLEHFLSICEYETRVFLMKKMSL